MRTIFALAALTMAVPASAGDACWQFKPGQTFTYELKSEFHYISRPMTTANRGFGEGGGTTTEDPQWEEIVLEAQVVAVGDDGAARINFTIARVRVETRFDSSGDHAEWDSTESKTTDIIGYKRYEAILGHTFQAVIGADGAVREVKNGKYTRPETIGMKPLKKNEREEKAATATHNPTEAEAWLNLIFGMTPETKAAWERKIMIPGEEVLSVMANGTETVGKYAACAKSKMESKEKNRGVTEKELELNGPSDLQRVAAAMVKASEKKGESWFSRKAGCLVKAELEGATEMSSAGQVIRTHIKWDVLLKERGFRELTPGDGNTPDGGNPVTETK